MAGQKRGSNFRKIATSRRVGTGTRDGRRRRRDWPRTMRRSQRRNAYPLYFCVRASCFQRFEALNRHFLFGTKERMGKKEPRAIETPTPDILCHQNAPVPLPRPLRWFSDHSAILTCPRTRLCIFPFFLPLSLSLSVFVTRAQVCDGVHAPRVSTRVSITR